MKKLWFRAKHYGWGWYPCSWEGWITLLVWVVLFTLTVVRIDDHEWLKNLIFIFIFTGILIWICYKKGEKPRWRWG
ncbi:MAG: hypothetical protein WCI72_02290 [archaeon]